MSFDLNGYVDVAERVAAFAEKYPEGSLQSTLEFIPEASGWMCRAEAYRTPDDPRPGVGHAFEPVPGKTPYTKDSEAMNAETSAWGRAIVALGFPTKKIASADEVKARQTGSQTPAAPSNEVTVDTPGSSEVGFGKHKGSLIRDVPKNYWEWWLASEMAAKPDFAGLRAEVEMWMGLTEQPEPVAAQAGTLGSELGDIPFAPVIA
jgi:hypothetical protein